jgi:hypothetical protein
MNTPGFVAEASLHQTPTLYKFPIGAHELDSPKIIPQQYCTTKTSCWGIVQLCKDECNYPGEHYVGSWYFCGFCFGLPF